MNNMNENIYIALDFPSWKEAKGFINEHHFHGVPVKIGMELFYQEGPMIIDHLKANNHPIFLDLKLHDIPTTVHKAMKNISSLGVDIVNVHAFGGMEMMKQAKEGLLSGSNRKETKLLAVTILTSLDDETLNNELLLRGNVRESAVHFADLANKSGVDGVVCSVHEASDIKAICGDSFLTVTPGIRLKESKHNDQKRIANPGFARNNQADSLVIGRSITQASNPYKAYEQAVKEWEHGIK